MNDRIAIVTGAAKGIGLAIVQRLLVDGFKVIAVDVDEKAGADAFSDPTDGAVVFRSCDISNEQQVAALFESIHGEFGSVDVLVNNAGIIRDKMIWKMSLEDFEKVVDVNLKGTWLMCRAASRIMKEQGSGRIINIASRAWLGNRGQSNYAASKAGIVSLSRVLALELGRSNVFVNTIAPGLIDTPLTRSLPDEIQEKLIEAQPTRAMGKPEDVANAVAFLAAPSTQFITGQLIYVDGGKSIGAGI